MEAYQRGAPSLEAVQESIAARQQPGAHMVVKHPATGEAVSGEHYAAEIIARKARHDVRPSDFWQGVATFTMGQAGVEAKIDP